MLHTYFVFAYSMPNLLLHTQPNSIGDWSPSEIAEDPLYGAECCAVQLFAGCASSLAMRKMSASFTISSFHATLKGD